MLSATNLIAKVDAALRQVNATDRQIYKRVITRTGGDALIGRPGGVSVVDTLLDPQPAIRAVTSKDTMVVDGGLVAMVADWIATMSTTCLSRADLANKDLLLVFKDGSAEEEFVVTSLDPWAAGGVDIAYDVALRSRKQ